jgi:hypothetical protein
MPGHSLSLVQSKVSLPWQLASQIVYSNDWFTTDAQQTSPSLQSLLLLQARKLNPPPPQSGGHVPSIVEQVSQVGSVWLKQHPSGPWQVVTLSFLQGTVYAGPVLVDDATAVDEAMTEDATEPPAPPPPPRPPPPEVDAATDEATVVTDAVDPPLPACATDDVDVFPLLAGAKEKSG